MGRRVDEQVYVVILAVELGKFSVTLGADCAEDGT
jgi:hypothetical protein